MRNCAFLFALLLSVGNIFAQSEKTLVRELDPKGSQDIKIDIRNNEIQPSIWDANTLHIELIVKANMPTPILEQLIKAGRYKLEAVKEGDSYVIKAPNIDKTVTIKGKDLEEEIYVSVKTPGKFHLANNTLSRDIGELGEMGAMAGRNATKEEMAAFQAKVRAVKAINEVGKAEVKVQSSLKNPNVDYKIQYGEILIDGVVLEIE